MKTLGGGGLGGWSFKDSLDITGNVNKQDSKGKKGRLWTQ